jgi:N-acetylneuraminic acid mutarotase
MMTGDRTTAAILASAAVIATAVALANPFRRTTPPIHTGSTLAATATTADQTSAPTTSPTKAEATTPNDPNAMTVASAPAEWEALPPSPSSRWEALPDLPGKPTFKPLVVALGKELLVVGGYGSLQPDQVPETAGAIFDGRTWRAIPDAPVPLAAEMSAVWTGSIMLAVSTDGTITSFTPGADRWDVLGHAPPPNRIGAEVVWTGDEMLLASGGLPGITELQGGMNIINEAVAYRPSTKTWRTIPRPPTKDPLTGQSVWTGKEWVRMVGWSEGKFDDFGSVAAYDPKSNRWRELPSLAASQPPTAILMEGNDLVAYTSTERWRLDGEAWLSAGALPPVSGYTSGIGEAWLVGGQVIRTKTDASGYFEALELLDATGRWLPLGEPFPGMGVDAIMKAVYDRLVVITNGKAARLREP